LIAFVRCGLLNPHPFALCSTQGRKPKPGKSFAERGRKTPQNNPLKDNEINRKIDFTVPDQRQFYLDQLKADVDVRVCLPLCCAFQHIQTS
jgi:hypothetical protein